MTGNPQVKMLEFCVAGGFRSGGQLGTIAVATADDRESSLYETRLLPAHSSRTPTIQRANITAIVIALQLIHEIYLSENRPVMQVSILSSSQFMVKCMNENIFEWALNDWLYLSGRDDRDLFQKAYEWHNMLVGLDSSIVLKYDFIPAHRNSRAYKRVDDAFDEMALSLPHLAPGSTRGGFTSRGIGGGGLGRNQL